MYDDDGDYSEYPELLRLLLDELGPQFDLGRRRENSYYITYGKAYPIQHMDASQVVEIAFEGQEIIMYHVHKKDLNIQVVRKICDMGIPGIDVLRCLLLAVREYYFS